jgi:hypothetical protein
LLKQVEELTSAAPFGDGRVHLGLAFDAYFLPKEIVVDLFERARRAGAKLITSHYVRGAILGAGILDKYMSFRTARKADLSLCRMDFDCGRN